MSGEPTVLTCGNCDQELYRATQATYNAEALLKAVREHKTRCKNTTPRPQGKEAE